MTALVRAGNVHAHRASTFLPCLPVSARILIIRGGAIGDFILTLPVLAALRERFPGVRLEVLGYPHIVSLALAGGLADAVKSIESRPLAGFFARGGDLDFDLSAYLAGFPVIFSYLYDPDEIFRDNLARISRAQVIQGVHRPDEWRGLHATEQLLEPLQRLAIFDADPVPRLKFPAHGLESGRPVPVLAVHPGSGSETKNWREENWAGLLSTLAAETDLRFLLVGGEAEGGRLERLAAALPATRVELLRSRPLPEVAARLAGCAGFVGHDSGVSHLAAAVGLPGLVLWGPTNPVIWRPRSGRFGLLTAAEGLTGLGVNAVAAELRARLAEWRLTAAGA